MCFYSVPKKGNFLEKILFELALREKIQISRDIEIGHSQDWIIVRRERPFFPLDLCYVCKMI